MQSRAAVKLSEKCRSGRERISDGDDDLAARVGCPQVAHGLRGLAQWVRSVDDWTQLAGFKQLLQNNQVLVVRSRMERALLLAEKHRGGRARIRQRMRW
jgi:hypothetical protein